MRMKIKFAVVALLLYVSPAHGQSASDFEMRYGKPIKVYTVSEHIWMAPEFAADGQVCRIQLYPRRIAPNTVFLSGPLIFGELEGVLNQLVPFNSRGLKKESFGLTATGGGAAWTTYPYEKVTFIFTFPLRVNSDPQREIKHDLFSVGGPLPTVKKINTAPSAGDFSRNQAAPTELVTIEWNEKKCIER